MKQIKEVLSGIRPEFDFETSEDFIADGMLDSLDVVMLVAELDKSYSISIAGIDIVPENLRNLSAIQGLVQKYAGKP